jgi:hypothetical protein
VEKCLTKLPLSIAASAAALNASHMGFLDAQRVRLAEEAPAAEQQESNRLEEETSCVIS